MNSSVTNKELLENMNNSKINNVEAVNGNLL